MWRCSVVLKAVMHLMPGAFNTGSLLAVLQSSIMQSDVDGMHTVTNKLRSSNELRSADELLSGDELRSTELRSSDELRLSGELQSAELRYVELRSAELR